MGLRRILRNFRWKPKDGIVYKSWHKGDSHFGKSATVTIFFEESNYEGSFKVYNGLCEIRMGKGRYAQRLITSSKNVSFSRKVKHTDTIWGGPRLGQNGYVGTEIKYTARVLDSKAVNASPNQGTSFEKGSSQVERGI